MLLASLPQGRLRGSARGLSGTNCSRSRGGCKHRGPNPGKISTDSSRIGETGGRAAGARGALPRRFPRAPCAPGDRFESSDEVCSEIAEGSVAGHQALVGDPGTIREGVEEQVGGLRLEQLQPGDPEPGAPGPPGQLEPVVGPVVNPVHVLGLEAALAVEPQVEAMR